MCTIVLLKVYVIMIVVVYLLFLLLDCLFGFGTTLTYRVKKENNRYYIQARWVFSPFWDYYGEGDLSGALFSKYSFDSKETAEEFINKQVLDRVEAVKEEKQKGY